MFHLHPQLSTFDTKLNSPYGIGENFQNNVPVSTQFNLPNSVGSSLNPINKNIGGISSNYDPKKQGFSISEEIKEGSVNNSQ